MKTESRNSAHLSVVQQITNNTTSWIGHRTRDNENVVGGQTFITPADGDLENIEVFSAHVTKPGKVTMTLHHFDPLEKSWGPVIGSASIEINNTAVGKWVSFNIPGLRLDKGKTYGFRLESPDTYIGIGEAAGSHHTPPYSAGQEWQFLKKDQKGHSFSYFSLAFKVGIRA